MMFEAESFSVSQVCRRFRCRACRPLLLSFLISISLPALAVEVAKSPLDDRQYRYLLLPNNLPVLLISDPAADKAAAALDVFAGSAHDPLDRQGLAHFLEHMLFLGTEKYPAPDGFQEFINERGGSRNAYTAFEHTNFYFDIDPQYLAGGLDRFARFFTTPLFERAYVERERHAVHSEYQARLKDEYRRTLDVYRQIMNPQHPLSKFSMGNLSTLSNDDGDDLREDLIDFFQRHYNARTMSLVVLGNASLDQLEAMVKPRFARIPNRHSAASASTEEEGEEPAKYEQSVEPLFRRRPIADAGADSAGKAAASAHADVPCSTG